MKAARKDEAVILYLSENDYKEFYNHALSIYSNKWKLISNNRLLYSGTIYKYDEDTIRVTLDYIDKYSMITKLIPYNKNLHFINSAIYHDINDTYNLYATAEKYF